MFITNPSTLLIHSLLSSLSYPTQALDKAKDAGRKERVLCKQREQAQATDQINLDLTYCVSNAYSFFSEGFIYSAS